MSTKSILAVLTMAAVTISFGLTEANAGLPMPPGLPGSPNVNVRVNGYLPAPPGVNIQIDAGRPYYVEGERRVYIEKRKPSGHYKKEKKHHKDNGHKNGHYKQKKHDH